MPHQPGPAINPHLVGAVDEYIGYLRIGNYLRKFAKFGERGTILSDPYPASIICTPF